MIEVVTYSDIVKSVKEVDSRRPIRMSFMDSVDPVSSNAMAEMNNKTRKGCLVGVLFCNPNTSFCKTEILSNLNYFHHRSGKNINFFCCGYGAYWPPGKFLDQITVVSVDGVDWNYSDQALISVIREFEEKTKW